MHTTESYTCLTGRANKQLRSSSILIQLHNYSMKELPAYTKAYMPIHALYIHLNESTQGADSFMNDTTLHHGRI